MKILFGAVALIAVIVVAIVLFALAIRALLRDPKRYRSGGSLSSAVLEVQSLLEPSKKHTVESVREREDEERDDSGAPPESPDHSISR